MVHPMTDHLADLGSLGFTYRTRRLADRIADSGRRFYEAVDVPLEPNWHALLLYLDVHGPVPVTEAAAALRVSHPAIIEMGKRMEAKGLVTTASDPADGRRRVLALLTRRYGELPPGGGEAPDVTYVQPSRPISISKWDYTSPQGLQHTYDLGRRDGEDFVARSGRA